MANEKKCCDKEFVWLGGEGTSHYCCNVHCCVPQPTQECEKHEGYVPNLNHMPDRVLPIPVESQPRCEEHENCEVRTEKVEAVWPPMEELEAAANKCRDGEGHQPQQELKEDWEQVFSDHWGDNEKKMGLFPGFTEKLIGVIKDLRANARSDERKKVLKTLETLIVDSNIEPMEAIRRLSKDL